MALTTEALQSKLFDTQRAEVLASVAADQNAITIAKQLASFSETEAQNSLLHARAELEIILAAENHAEKQELSDANKFQNAITKILEADTTAHTVEKESSAASNNFSASKKSTLSKNSQTFLNGLNNNSSSKPESNVQELIELREAQTNQNTNNNSR